MPLQNFIARSTPAISADWLNEVDRLKFTVFDDADTKAEARAALGFDPQLISSGTDTGAANAYVVTVTPGTIGFLRLISTKVSFAPANANTGPSTLNVNGTGAAAVLTQSGVACTGGELSATVIVEWTGADWRIISGFVPLANRRSTVEVATAVTPVNYGYTEALDPRRYKTILSASFTTDRNVSWGYEAFQNATPGVLNVAIGYRSQRAATTGGGGIANAQGNTSVGAESMSAGTLVGDFNTAMGYLSMANATSAYCNAAFGLRTLTALTSGQYNTGLGCDVLLACTTADQNTGVGAKAFLDLTTGANNVGVGVSAWENMTTGNWNTAVGTLAGLTTTIGGENVAVGGHALELNVTASFNTFVGYFAGRNTTAASNTGLGHESMANNTTGTENTAAGAGSLDSNTTGSSNTALGRSALGGNVTGSNNTAVGKDSLLTSTDGNNTAFGYFSGRATTTGSFNTFGGRNGGAANTTGSFHVCLGDNALTTITTGNDCTAIGYQALTLCTGSDNTAIGYQAGDIETTGTTNTFVGFQAGHTQTAGFSNTTNLGNGANSDASNVITLGNASVATLRCQQTAITALSDIRFKKNRMPFDIPDAFLDEVEIVTFEWISEKMTPGMQVGVIAQELDALQNKYGLQWMGLVSKANPESWEATPGKLLFPLIVKSQRLTARVSELEAKLAALEARVNLLVG